VLLPSLLCSLPPMLRPEPAEAWPGISQKMGPQAHFATARNVV
jgi:hypothetical protein